MFVLFLLFVVAPVVELYVIVQVSTSIGFLETLVLLVAVAAIGAWLVKREGLRVFRRYQEQVAAGRTPEREIVDGMLLLMAGAMMMAPGFVSDVLALVLVIPPTRALVRTYVMRRGLGRAGRVRVVRATYSGPTGGATSTTILDTSVTDTTATEPRGEIQP